MAVLIGNVFFFFNDTATTEIYTLSLHDALPIYRLKARPGAFERLVRRWAGIAFPERFERLMVRGVRPDRKSTRLNSSHANISYAVFCLKKKKNALATHNNLYVQRTNVSQCNTPS